MVLILRSLLSLCALIAVLLTSTAPVAAHRPYFTQIEKVELPDGTIGEIRLLHGDGIIMSDPVRAIVVGADERLRARSAQTGAMILLCSREHKCRAIDLHKDLAFEIDPATFRLGSEIPIGADWKLGAVEQGSESWGFRSRRATFVEILWGNFVFVRHFFIHHVVILILLGMVAAAISTVAFRRPRSKPTWVVILWMVELLLRIVFAGFAVAISIFWAGIFGSTGLVWLASIAFGAALVLMPVLLRRRMALRLRPN